MRENSGKPVTHQQRQVVADEIRLHPELPDEEIASNVAPKIQRLLHRSTIQRIRNEFSLPKRRDAEANTPTPLTGRNADRVSALLNRLFVPRLDECGWQSSEAPDRLSIRSCVRGEFRIFRRKGRIEWIWLTPDETSQFLDLVLGHLGRADSRLAGTRFRRLRSLVTRQIQLTIGRDFAFREGVEDVALPKLQSYLDGGMRLGWTARRQAGFKLVNRHPRLSARVDEFVSWMQARLMI